MLSIIAALVDAQAPGGEGQKYDRLGLCHGCVTSNLLLFLTMSATLPGRWSAMLVIRLSTATPFSRPGPASYLLLYGANDSDDSGGGD
jgi:hypothetical protein